VGAGEAFRSSASKIEIGSGSESGGVKRAEGGELELKMRWSGRGVDYCWVRRGRDDYGESTTATVRRTTANESEQQGREGERGEQSPAKEALANKTSTTSPLLSPRSLTERHSPFLPRLPLSYENRVQHFAQPTTATPNSFALPRLRMKRRTGSTFSSSLLCCLLLVYSAPASSSPSLSVVSVVSVIPMYRLPSQSSSH
jgi:hypothetical protein